MLKRLALTVVAILFTASALFAAPMKGTVKAIDGQKVQITLVGEKADWVKKGAPVKIKGGTGKIVEVEGTKDATVTITTSKAKDLKAGDEVSIDKGTGMSGC